jgi:hypothetical protein
MIIFALIREKRFFYSAGSVGYFGLFYHHVNLIHFSSIALSHHSMGSRSRPARRATAQSGRHRSFVQMGLMSQLGHRNIWLELLRVAAVVMQSYKCHTGLYLSVDDFGYQPTYSHHSKLEGGGGDLLDFSSCR